MPGTARKAEAAVDVGERQPPQVPADPGNPGPRGSLRTLADKLVLKREG